MIDTKALRNRILDLAIQGKLTEQLESDGTAEELYQQIQAEKQKRIKEGKLKNEKPLPEITADETPFNIPHNWSVKRLGDYVERVTDQVASGSFAALRENVKSLKSADYALMVKTADFSNNFTKNLTYTDEHGYNFLSNSNLFGGELILSNVGSIGKCFIVPKLNMKMTLAPNAVMIRLIEDEQRDFLYYFIQSSIGQNAIKAITTGVAMLKFNKTELKKIAYPFPPLAEQKRIVERVEEIFRLLDTIDKAQEKYSADSQILKAKLITAGIQGKLTKQLESDGTAHELYQQIQEEKQKLIKEGKIKKEKPLPPISPDEIPFEIPQNWMWVRLVDITTKITSGSTPPGGKKGNSYVPQGFCFFREQNIYNDGIHHDGMVYISEELLNTRENSTVLPNDILLNITGGSIGRCAIIPDDFSKGSINQHILIIRLVEKEMLNYIHDLLCSPYYQRIIKSKVVGDKDGFSGGRCKATLIPLPPLAEQKRIADVLERVLGVVE